MKFWEIEECPNNETIKYSAEELEVIEHFKTTHKRNSEGRFIVRLPFKTNITELGESKQIAVKRFIYLERKLNSNAELKLNYDVFFHEYENLKHMQLLDDNNLHNSKSYFLPHHAVIKELSATTKLRVVFDASAKTSTGISLNDTLKIGPKLQDDLFCILIRFRSYQYVLSTDIAKMFRQILVAEEDKGYQRILWRYDRSQPLSVYELNTVTYETTCAPFLAVQCLKQLASDEKHDFPLALQVLERDFYMDDLLTGVNTVTEALQLRSDLQLLLARGGFQLRKWPSNEPSILKSVNNDATNSHMINLEADGNMKLLGLWWNYKNDYLNYLSSETNLLINATNTKRSILSQVAQIFDPLGLLGPIVIKVKLIIQKLWQFKQNWDQPIPSELNQEWLQILTQMREIKLLKIPRKAIRFYPYKVVELHGFADASVLRLTLLC